MALLSTHWPILALAYVGANVFILAFFVVGAGKRTRPLGDAAGDHADQEDRAVHFTEFFPVHSNSTTQKDA